MHPPHNRQRVIPATKLIELRSAIPQSWKAAKGILKGRKAVDPIAYQQKMRREWERYAPR